MKLTLIFATILCMGVSSCTIASVHNNFLIKDITSYQEARKKIPNGMTQDQVFEAIGEPNAKASDNNGTTWTYTYTEGTLGGAINLLTGVSQSNVKVIVVTFNSKGRVRDLQYRDQTSGRVK